MTRIASRRSISIVLFVTGVCYWGYGAQAATPEPFPRNPDHAQAIREAKPTGFAPQSSLSGQSGIPAINWDNSGLNEFATAGPTVSASVNGKGGQGPVFLGTGASFVKEFDLYLPLNGIDWFHQRTYSSLNGSSLNWLGENWWGNEMIHIDVAGADGTSDVALVLDPHHTLNFSYSAGSWTCDDNFLYKLTYSSGNNEYTVTRADGHKFIFYNQNYLGFLGERLKRVEDPYGNDWTLTWTFNGILAIYQLTAVTVDVVEGGDHKITYAYFTSGDNNGKLQYIKTYKSTTTTSANLIGQIEFVYHDSGSDIYGILGDLMKTIVTQKGTSDGDGVLSIEKTTHYRYYKGAYNATINPGTDHELRYVLLPENAQRVSDDYSGADPTTKSNGVWENYANVIYEYDSNGRVRETKERLPGLGCGCGGGGGAPATTSYTWTTNTGSPNLDTWMIHCVADREDNTRVIFDCNRWHDVLTWVVQDEDDGTPTRELIWHFDYGTSGDTEHRLTAAHNPSAVTDYNETTYAVTLASGAGIVQTVEYDTGTYAGYPKKCRIKKGNTGSLDTLVEYTRDITARPDLVKTIKHYETGGELNGRLSTIAHSFYDSGGAKVQIKQIDVTHPSVGTGNNGPGSSAVTKNYYDKRSGDLRWTLDGEGFVEYHAYDDETGVGEVLVQDANTSTLMTAIDDTWDGNIHGGLTNDDDVPFSRTGVGTALDLDTVTVRDWWARPRKITDAEGMITFLVYKDDETWIHPAWEDTPDTTELPTRILLTDKDGRVENIITLDNDTVINTTAGEPDGTTTYGNGNKATWTIHEYDRSGMRTRTDRYHNIPATGNGTRYTNFYRTENTYDELGRLATVTQDVADESTYDREQVTQYTYDFVGRRVKVEEGVSDNTHNITVGLPTLTTTMEYYYDEATNATSTPSQGEGDGLLRYVRKHYGTGAGESVLTEYRYTWRNNASLIVPPLAPYTLVGFDNLDRPTGQATYSATTNLDPGDPPGTTEDSNRTDYSTTKYDEWGRVYQTVNFDDPSNTPPADGLESDTYHDRRGLVWAVDAANTGIAFTKYDGAGRRTETLFGTAFDTDKYTSSAPDYPDNNEKIVHTIAYTLDDVGNVEKMITTELNHDDTNGYDAAGSDHISSYVYNWYDVAHRLTDTANYGTNDSQNRWKDASAPTYGASAPTRSATLLVTTHVYSVEGWREEVTDPRNILTEYLFDDLGRMLAKTEDSGVNLLNRKTEYEYNGLNGMTQIIADLAADNTISAGDWTMAGVDEDQVTEYAYTDAQNARWVKEIRYPTGDGTVGSAQADKIVFTYNVDGTLNDRTDQNGTVIAFDYDDWRRQTAAKANTLGTYTGGAGAVDGAIRAITKEYDDENRISRITSHSDTSPDTTDYTDAVNQIDYVFNAADQLTDVKQDITGKVTAGTLAVQYGYGTDYATGNYNRRDYTEYPNDGTPDGRKVWYGYTHSGGASTFQDTINDAFNRIGQIAKDNSGAIGDIYAEYDANGLARYVRKSYPGDDVTGFYGNDTRADLWHGTTGEYLGLDAVGRIKKLKHTEFSGTAVDFFDLDYTYDANSNRTVIQDNAQQAASLELAYDNLNRLTDSKRGHLDTSEQATKTNQKSGFKMDILGNFTATGGISRNGVSSTLIHETNATNELTKIDYPNASGAAAFISDDFKNDLGTVWTAIDGTWSISSEQVNVDTLATGEAYLKAKGLSGPANTTVKVVVPSGSPTGLAGIVFSRTGDDYYRVVLDMGNGRLQLDQVINGESSNLASTGATITAGTTYELRVFRTQSRVEAYVIGQSASITYDSSTVFDEGDFGLFSTATSVKFDDFEMYDVGTRNPLHRVIGGLPDISGGTDMLVTGDTRGGLAIVSAFADDSYLVQVDVNLNGGSHADVWFRRLDPNNGYVLRLKSNNKADLIKVVNGKYTTLVADQVFTPATPNAVTILAGRRGLSAWINGTLEFNASESTFPTGGVGLTGPSAKFDNLKVGYDNNGDNDIDDAGDDVFVDENFGTTDFTPAYDDAGNLVDDGIFRYVYDAWNRLVKVQRANDGGAVTIQESEFFGDGQRGKKVVTNSGSLDGTLVYYHSGNRICQIDDGSGNMKQQFIHGLTYIDELVMVRVADSGEFFYHQDANWNVLGVTDMGGNLVERYRYEPYGEMIVDAVTGFGDRDGSQTVDSTDKGTPGTTCSTMSGACRILDLDFDEDYDTADGTKFDSLAQGLAWHPGRAATSVSQPFGHQGLLFEPEIGSYQNRARQYLPTLQRFAQRDPLGVWPPSAGGYADGINTYLYLEGNPQNFLDPLGLFSWNGFWGGITGGMITGAVAGSTLFPGLGTIGGAIVGGIVGGIFGGTTQDSFAGGVAVGAVGGVLGAWGAAAGLELLGATTMSIGWSGGPGFFGSFYFSGGGGWLVGHPGIAAVVQMPGTWTPAISATIPILFPGNLPGAGSSAPGLCITTMCRAVCAAWCPW